MTVEGSGEEFIHARIDEPGHAPWLITFVYLRPNPQFKDAFWTEMIDFSRSLSSPWLMIGNFNDYANAQEKWGGVNSQNRCNLFTEGLQDCSLSDIGEVPTGGSRS